MLVPWKKSYDQPREHIKKERHYFVSKGPSSQSYGFSSGHVWMWELDYKEGWVPKNGCFWSVVLEKTLESPLDSKEIRPVSLKEISPEYSLEGLMLKRKLQYFGHLMRRTDSFEKTLMLGKIEGWRRRGWQRMRWLDGITDSMEMSLSLGVGDGQGGLACFSPRGRRESDMNEQLNWTDQNQLMYITSIFDDFQRQVPGMWRKNLCVHSPLWVQRTLPCPHLLTVFLAG